MAPRDPRAQLYDKLDGRMKEGGLRRQLRLKKGDKFTKPDINKLARVAEGKSFLFKGNQFKMTKLLKKRILLAKTMMKA
jgi:hypothetical protein